MAKNSFYHINTDKLKNTLLSIKARFESDTINKMTDVADMYSTGLKKALGMGHDSFTTKFSQPQKLTVEDIFKLSDISNVDKNLIWRKVSEEVKKDWKTIDLEKIIEEIRLNEQKRK